MFTLPEQIKFNVRIERKKSSRVAAAVYFGSKCYGRFYRKRGKMLAAIRRAVAFGLTIQHKTLFPLDKHKKYKPEIS